MVRNARFSWDDTDNVELPNQSLRIDDLDDPGCEPPSLEGGTGDQAEDLTKNKCDLLMEAKQ